MNQRGPGHVQNPCLTPCGVQFGRHESHSPCKGLNIQLAVSCTARPVQDRIPCAVETCLLQANMAGSMDQGFVQLLLGLGDGCCKVRLSIGCVSRSQDTSTALTKRVKAMIKYSNDRWRWFNQTMSRKDSWLMTREGCPKRKSEETGVGDGPSQDDHSASL